MKAVQFNEFGGPEVLHVAEVAPPHAGPGQIRIAVRAAGLNPVDWKIRAGYLRELFPTTFPSGIGMDAAGVVDEVGEGVTNVAIGDAVFGLGFATYAEYAVLSNWAVKPANLSFEEAAGYGSVSETALRILHQVGVKPGQTLLVSGGAGGVGSALLQIARHRGIKVIATASQNNQEYLKSLGAIPTTYGEGLSDRVRALAPQGIDAALDVTGFGVIPELVALAGSPSKVITIADFSAGEHGVQFSAGGEHSAESAAALPYVAQLFSAGAFTIPISKTFPLAAAGEAQALSAEGHVVGKLIITVG